MGFVNLNEAQSKGKGNMSIEPTADLDYAKDDITERTYLTAKVKMVFGLTEKLDITTSLNSSFHTSLGIKYQFLDRQRMDLGIGVRVQTNLLSSYGHALFITNNFLIPTLDFYCSINQSKNRFLINPSFSYIAIQSAGNTSTLGYYTSISIGYVTEINSQTNLKFGAAYGAVLDPAYGNIGSFSLGFEYRILGDAKESKRQKRKNKRRSRKKQKDIEPTYKL